MDWQAWHDPYDDPASPLSHRLRLVQQHIGQWLDERPEEKLTVVSLCAGQGRDLIGVLADRPDRERVRATLVELDERNAASASARAAAAGLDELTVRPADAGLLSSYEGAVPADLVLAVGVLGNITDTDVRATVAALPRLCADGATVIWSRTREAPDLTPTLRGWFAEEGFTELAFHAPADVLFSVGVHRFTGRPQPLGTDERIFTFTFVQ